MKSVSELIVDLKNLSCRNYFPTNQNIKIIVETENKLNIQFPKAVKEFYTIYNGGFILDSSISDKRYDDCEFYFDEIEWSSNAFLKLEDIVYYYDLNEDYAINYKREEQLNSKRLIPFFRTKSKFPEEGYQGFLVLADDSTILWAKQMENNKIEWINRFENFESLLNEYIKNEGNIRL